MEKIKIASFAPKDLEKIKQDTYNRIIEEPLIKKFINDYGVPLNVVYDNLGVFLTYLESTTSCDECGSYSNCKSNIKGFICELVYDEGRQLINLNYLPCKKYTNILKKQSRFLFYEYDGSLFEQENIRINQTKYRAPIFAKMGEILIEKSSKGLYLYGKSGTGKSYLMAVLAQKLVDEGKTCAFIRSSTLIDRLRDFLLDDSALFNEEIEKFKNVDVLIIDDIGGEKTTVWARDEVLYAIIDYRSKNKDLITCFTSNYSLNDYQKVVAFNDPIKGERLTSLIGLVADEMELIDLDRRT